jgi:hypothetical protein
MQNYSPVFMHFRAFSKVSTSIAVSQPIRTFQPSNPKVMDKFIPKVHKSVGKVCALVATTLILPVLAYAGGNNNDQGDNNNQNVHSVPDVGPGIVLLTTAIGAVLLFGAKQRSRSEKYGVSEEVAQC